MPTPWPFNTWLALLGAIMITCSVAGRAQEIFAKGLLFPAYINQRPAAVLRVSELRTEYERRGFFRIGALPCLLLDGTEIHFFTNGCSTEALKKLNRAITSKAAGRRIRFNDISLVASNATLSAVAARSMTIDPLGNWHFKNGEVALGDVRSKFQTATLFCSSSNAGTFVMNNSLPLKFQLLTHQNP